MASHTHDIRKKRAAEGAEGTRYKERGDIVCLEHTTTFSCCSFLSIWCHRSERKDAGTHNQSTLIMTRDFQWAASVTPFSENRLRFFFILVPFLILSVLCMIGMKFNSKAPHTGTWYPSYYDHHQTTTLHLRFSFLPYHFLILSFVIFSFFKTIIERNKQNF